MTAYARLTARFARIATLGEASSMLGWDAAAMMPPGGGAARGDQLAVLAGVAHGLLTAPEAAADLAQADADGDEWDAANLGLMRHAHIRATAVPADLVEAQARANSACEKVWRQARGASDFAAVSPYLVEVVSLVRQTADAMAPTLGLSSYDALMDGYQRGIGAADVAPVFARYETFLHDALPRAEEHQARQPPPVALPGVFPADRQEGLCRHLSARAGLEFEHARLDRSTHPFCGGTPTDVRITTRYDETDPAQALMGVLHETGHALYERGLPAGYARQPVGEAAGMAAHESQSLIVEMQSCRSDPFLAWLGPELHGTFGGSAEPYASANLSRLWRRVERGFIRVDADEMTYPAHVILRFRLEQALVSGDLPVADLPGAWRDGMMALLGVAPPDDARGCLQDIHWYDGAFGYFPSYTLGAMAAAQLMAAARRDVADLDAGLGRGELGPLVGWLRLHVHGQGSRLGFNDLLRAATGKPLDPADFEAHLTARYLADGHSRQA
jgi:carboxypeptidase Taq